MWLKTGFTQSGEIPGSHIKTWLDGGAYGSYGVDSTFYTGVINPVTYKMPVYKFEGARVFTNKPPCGPKRGCGVPWPRLGPHRGLFVNTPTPPNLYTRIL